MKLFNSHRRRLFLLPLSSVCAACVGLAMPATAQDEGDQDQDQVVNVTDFETVDLAVQDADLAQVLQMLSLQSRKNIITSRNVSATVTANLYDVTFHEALDAILKVNGYTYTEEGNFIYVYTMEEYAEMEEAQRQRVSRIFNLNYLAAVDALEFVTPMLSEGGNASARGEVTPGMQPTIDDAGADDYPYEVKVVVYDYPENIDLIEALIEELDTPPDQVLVESTILQTSVDEADAFGIDFNIIGGMDFTNVINPLNAVTSLLSGSAAGTGFQPSDNEAQGIQSNVGNTSGPGGLKIGIVSNDISVFLRVLDQVTDTTVLARPKVMALNRQRAEVLVGARVGYLSTTSTETTTTQTVEFLDTGIQLVFRPFISKDGSIRMELRPSVSEASLRTVTDSLGVQVTIPDELTNELTTNVRVRDGQTLILGGLFRESTTTTRRQVPLLGDIPVLGAAFRGQDDSVERSEIIFLITPTITKDEVLWENGEDALAFAELVRIGAREGLLPFSREKMTATHNRHAVAAQQAGDTELALFHVRNSLRLNPHQPSVIAMRQQLTGDMDHRYEDSMLERIINTGVEHHLSFDAVTYTKAEPQQAAPQFTGNPLIEVHQISDESNDDGFDNGAAGESNSSDAMDSANDAASEGAFNDGNAESDEFNDADFGEGEFDDESGDFDAANDGESDSFDEMSDAEFSDFEFNLEDEGNAEADAFSSDDAHADENTFAADEAPMLNVWHLTSMNGGWWFWPKSWMTTSPAFDGENEAVAEVESSFE